MKSLKELYKIGRGPSSSHTMGPSRAAEIYARRHPDAKGFEVTLYGSLSATGKGHLTDIAIKDKLEPVAPVDMGLEHHLGMTCDPVCGLVQVPCIERNAFAATRALDANFYAMFSDGRHIVSFDDVVKVMKQTGHDLPNLYKETGIGGLAASYKK